MAKTHEQAEERAQRAKLSAAEFVRKWAPGGPADRLNERAGAQPHFIDLCQVLDVDAPTDPESYCFERGLWGLQGGNRFADVWRRQCFAWEYKAPGGDLGKALAQLMQYALPLENPPLLIVSDRRQIRIHTHFTGHPSVQYDIALSDLRDPQRQALLRSAFVSPQDFRPALTTRDLTASLAGTFAEIADALRARGETPFRSAHFLTQCMFCCFAEDSGVLPEHVFRRVVVKRQTPAALRRSLSTLFTTMQTGGDFGADTIPWFNGGLFKAVDVPLLTVEEIETLGDAAAASWAFIDPCILGTLFERGLDPGKRSQMGAHYTDAVTIERLIDPVVRRPLLAEWDDIKRAIAGLIGKRDMFAVRAKGVPSKTPALKARYGALRSHATQARKKAQDLLSGYLGRLQSFRVLDPACGSGNFLFLSLKALKDIEHQVNHDAEELGLERQIPVTGPHNVLGIEVNQYAAELARATVWIGELQWCKEHGYGWKENPVLDPLDHIECRDAVLADDGHEAAWPAADAVVGNPPFVGDKKMRRELGDDYTERLRAAYKGRVPGGADLVCYWFEKARGQIGAALLERAGLVATNSIRQRVNRSVVDSVTRTARLFEAWSDLPWVNNGAAVRVSLLCFGASDQSAVLDGRPVRAILTDLRPDLGGANSLDLTLALPLTENEGVSFFGVMLAGPFAVEGPVARKWLREPNVGGRSNAEVLAPLWKGEDVKGRSEDRWVVDFGVSMDLELSALFEAPFNYVENTVKAKRLGNREPARAARWWIHGRARPELRSASLGLFRRIATIERAKHRFFVWLPSGATPEHRLVVFARQDDVTFGVLSSRLHVHWAIQVGSTLEDRPGYNTKVCFLPFPFPEGLTPADTADQRTETLPDGAVIPAGLPADVLARAEPIARAAHRLVTLRDAWLNPPEWTDRVPEVVPLGMASSPYPDRIVAKPGREADVAKRTLTNLYNARPAWLAQAHAALDTAVATAYGWADYTAAMADDEILRRLLALNRTRRTTADAAPD